MKHPLRISDKLSLIIMVGVILFGFWQLTLMEDSSVIKDPVGKENKLGCLMDTIQPGDSISESGYTLITTSKGIEV